jgi:Spy/CpxP family protein refolding chaperone
MVTRRGEAMTRTTRILSIGAVAAVALGSAVAVAGFGHGHNDKFMRKMVDAHVEEMLDSINATADQRQKVSAMEDKLFADFKQTRESHRSLMTALTDQFGRDQMDQSALDQAVQPMLQAQDQLRADLRQSVSNLHDLLTPDQRQKLVAQAKELQ